MVSLRLGETRLITKLSWKGGREWGRDEPGRAGLVLEKGAVDTS